MTNVNTIISAANTALQTLSSIGSQVQSGASSGSLNLEQYRTDHRAADRSKPNFPQSSAF